MEGRIILSTRDLLRLRALLSSHRASANDRAHVLDLQQEMDRAAIVDAAPTNVVAIGSTVIVLDVETGAHNHYTLVLPEQAEAAEGRISVLAPLGTALLGCRIGDIVEWSMPGGMYRLQIKDVLHAHHSGDDPEAMRWLAA
jgi:regulator of nucleoside diphosphate kinase